MEGAWAAGYRRNDKTATSAPGFLMPDPVLFPPPSRPGEFFSRTAWHLRKPGLRLAVLAASS